MEKDLLTGVKIRPFASEDLDRIIEIEYKALGKRRQDYWKKKTELSNPRYPFSILVAELEGKVIGFIIGEVSGWEFGVQDDTVGWLSTIGVDPDYQHRGVARNLMEVFIRNLKAIGVNVIYTLVNWRDWDLVNFLHTMGFNRGGEMINLELKVD